MAASALAARGLTMASFEGISKNEATIDKISKSYQVLKDWMVKNGWVGFTMNQLKEIANSSDFPADLREAAQYISSNPALVKATDSEFGRDQLDGKSDIYRLDLKMDDLKALKQDIRADKGSSSSITPNDVIDKARQTLPALMAKLKEKLDALEGNNNDPTKAMELKQAMDELSQMTKLFTKALDGITKPVGDTLDSMR